MRRNSRTPSAFSKPASVRDTAGWETPSSAAAPVKPAGVDDRGERTQVPDLDVHVSSV